MEKRDKRKLSVVLVFGLFMTLMPLILAAEPSAALFDATLISSRFYQEVSPYLVPSGMGGLSGLIVGIITTIIILIIFIDLLSIATPFSDWANWIISIGLGIIAVLFRINVTVAGWIFTIGSTIFAWTGAVAIFANIILGVLIILAVFIPMSAFTRYVKRLKIRKEEMRGEAGIARIKIGEKVMGEAGKVAVEEGK